MSDVDFSQPGEVISGNQPGSPGFPLGGNTVDFSSASFVLITQTPLPRNIITVGENRIIRRGEHGDNPFTPDNLALILTLPDGTLVDSSTIPAKPVAGASNAIWTLLAKINFTQAGEHAIQWAFTANGERYLRSETRFAFWTNPADYARNRSGLLITQLTDALVEEYAARLTRRLLKRYPCIGTYNALTGNDRRAFDEAIGLMAAARLERPSFPVNAPGRVVMKMEGDTRYQYGITAAMLEQERKDLLMQAAESLNLISCVRDFHAQAMKGGFTPFAVSGPSRTRAQKGYSNILLSSVMSVLLEDINLRPFTVSGIGGY